ncbi:hypothetical protein RKD23_005304 [Streptomyces sp. SAI-170]
MAAWIRPEVCRLDSPGCKKIMFDGVNSSMSAMSDASTSQPLSADAHEATGHGKHRGPVSAHDTESAPRGRHRKPVEQQRETAA